MKAVVSAIQNTISISQFNRGLAGKIFSEVKRTGTKVVMKRWKSSELECYIFAGGERRFEKT
jgi:hypothetical protein